MLRQAIAAALLAASPALADPTYITFKVPDSESTSVIDINAAGEVAGNYFTSRASFGYVRHADGAVESLAPHRGTLLALNDRGDVLGTRGFNAGFLRRADGTFRKIVVPDPDVSTSVAALNDDGMVAGYTSDSQSNSQGFIYSGRQRYELFDLPKYAFVDAISNSGLVAGSYITSPGKALFLRGTDGTIKVFKHKGSNPFRDVTSVNDAGEMTGNLGTVDGSELYRAPFVLSPDGTLQVFGVHPGHGAVARDINASGTVVGYFTSSHHSRGFLRASDGTITAFDCPNAISTRAEAINDSGVIAGTCTDAETGTSAFIRMP